MNVDNTDKLVAATLAAAVIAIEKPAKPIDQYMVYERILKLIGRRNDRNEAKGDTEA